MIHDDGEIVVGLGFRNKKKTKKQKTNSQMDAPVFLTVTNVYFVFLEINQWSRL